MLELLVKIFASLLLLVFTVMLIESGYSYALYGGLRGSITSVLASWLLTLFLFAAIVGVFCLIWRKN